MQRQGPSWIFALNRSWDWGILKIITVAPYSWLFRKLALSMWKKTGEHELTFAGGRERERETEMSWRIFCFPGGWQKWVVFFFLLVHAYTYKYTYLCTRKNKLYHVDIILSLYLIDIYIIYICISETNCFFRVAICIEADVSALWSARKKTGAFGAGVAQGLCNDLGNWMEIAWGCNCYSSQNLPKKHKANAVEINFPWKLEGCVAVSVCSWGHRLGNSGLIHQPHPKLHEEWKGWISAMPLRRYSGV